jgi:hypothetical protein
MVVSYTRKSLKRIQSSRGHVLLRQLCVLSYSLRLLRCDRAAKETQKAKLY